MREKITLAAIILVYLIIGCLYAFNTPDWQAPDEPAHYNYIRQLASGEFPVIETGDWDQEYQSLVISSGFDPQYDVTSFEYEDYQPPLYYLVATPVFALFDGDLNALRLVSLLLGAAVILLTYLIAIRLFPSRSWIVFTATAFLAFLPQHVAMLSSVNNDSLAELLIAGILLLLIKFSQQQANKQESGHAGASQGDISLGDQRTLVYIGVLLGLGFISKVTVYIMAPVVALTLLWLFWGRWQLLLKVSLVVFLPALLIGMGWWIRNVVVYDQLDPLGTRAHNALVVGQPKTADWIDELGLGGTLRSTTRTLFQSFWGQFGWMGVPMPTRIYQLLFIFSLLTGVGFFWLFVSKQNREELLALQINASEVWSRRMPALIFTTTFGLSLLLLIVYNFTFVQAQGRYLFPALVPISIATAVAWGALLWPFIRRRQALGSMLPLGLALGLVSLDLIALYRYILPALG